MSVPMSEGLRDVILVLVPGIGAAALSVIVTLVTLRVNAKKRAAEAGLLTAEAEKTDIESESCMTSMYRELLEELRLELERQQTQHQRGMAALRGELAAVEAEQERIRAHYQAQIEALEAKVEVLTQELDRERGRRLELQRKYEGAGPSGVGRP